MNRQQFMKAMEIHLRPMDPFERAELLADYDQHFELGLREGKLEEEIARELGQPEEIAKEALGDRYDMHTPGSDAFYAPTYREMRSPRNNTSATRKFFTAYRPVIPESDPWHSSWSHDVVGMACYCQPFLAGSGSCSSSCGLCIPGPTR